MNGSDTGSKRVKTIDTTIEVLHAVKELNGASISKLARHLYCSKSTIHSHVITLQSHGYLTKQRDGTYHLGLRFADLGWASREKYWYFDDIKSKVNRLANETGERAQYMTEENGLGVYLYRATGARAPPTDAEVGKPRELHVCASGKSILAHVDETWREEIIDRHGLINRTENTITDRETLRNTLVEIRKQGYAINDEESVEGVWGLGAPVMDEDRNVLGGLSISGPAHRMKNRENYVDHFANKVIGVTEEIGLNISYSK
jgi:DNA-binding IclR family transcriptional regulator